MHFRFLKWPFRKVLRSISSLPFALFLINYQIPMNLYQCINFFALGVATKIFDARTNQSIQCFKKFWQTIDLVWPEWIGTAQLANSLPFFYFLGRTVLEHALYYLGALPSPLPISAFHNSYFCSFVRGFIGSSRSFWLQTCCTWQVLKCKLAKENSWTWIQGWLSGAKKLI